MLFMFKKVDSLLCDFCGKELEIIKHLFFHCTNVSMFWNDLKSVLDSFNITIRFDIMNVLFGILDTDNISILVNYIILERKYFIYRCKLNKGCLCVRLLVDKFKKTFQTERFIAKRNNKIPFHDKKWIKFKSNKSCKPCSVVQCRFLSIYSISFFFFFCFV